jgi:bifunctional N-acetylglucosamine-1-phosphate-uridyltransferase/glucosamine-1-phosphate-acetyltransferase GlmU-like protein
MRISDYTEARIFHDESASPWEVCRLADEIIRSWIERLSSIYHVTDGIAIHELASVEPGAVLKAPCIISEGCFVASYAYLRGGVWLGNNVIIGPSTEVKSSFICANSKAAHFNFIGDSIIGENVNIEAGAILANFRNEWKDKEIICFDGVRYIQTRQNKFGSLIGDGTRIGANAVLAPGTVLKKGSVVKRLASIDQIPFEMQKKPG